MDVLFVKSFVHTMCFFKVELCWDVLLIFVVFSFVQITNSCCLFFMFIHSVTSFNSTCYEHISHSSAFFGNRFRWEIFLSFPDRLLVHFCHILEDHSEECIKNLKLIWNLLFENKLLSMNTSRMTINKANLEISLKP